MPILGYKKTGFLQIIEPKIIIRKAGRNNAYITAVFDKSCSVAQAKREELKLKFPRSGSRLDELCLSDEDIREDRSGIQSFFLWIHKLSKSTRINWMRKPPSANCWLSMRSRRD